MQPKYAISTNSGRFFDYLNPTGYVFEIYEIAHALSHICRYGGHSNSFYSVAEHSVHVSRLVPPELALCGLLHDASEAFVGDMPSPLKALCKEYRLIEDAVQKALAEQFGLQYPFPAAVHRADKMMYKSERLTIAPIPDLVWHTDIPAADIKAEGWTSYKARIQFLKRYVELTSVTKEQNKNEPTKESHEFIYAV